MVMYRYDLALVLWTFAYYCQKIEFIVFEMFFWNPIIQTGLGNKANHTCESTWIEKDKH